MTNESSPTESVTSEPPGKIHTARHSFAAGAGVILLLVFAVYWPALRGQFVWDDALLVLKNPLVLGKANLGSIWFHADFPLTNVALWLQWRCWGGQPLGFHVVNLLLHAANCVLLWRVLARLEIPGAWFAAILFAVHPVGAASAAWISEMKNTLSLLFVLMSFRWFLTTEDARGQTDLAAGHPADSRPENQKIESEQAPGRFRRAKKLYCLSLAAFLLALLAKTSAVMLPVALLGVAWWKRGRVSRHAVWRTIPFFLLALAFGGLTIWFQRAAIGTATVQTENFFGRLAGAGRALWFYLGKILWPLKLSAIYPRWTLDTASPAAYLPALLWSGGLILCGGFRRGRGRAALFALGIFTAMLLPVLGFFNMYFLALSRVSDHFQYLPMIAVVALVAAALRTFLKPPAFRGTAAALTLGLSVLTWQRAHVFRDDETLWRDTLGKNPGAWTAHNNLGCLLAQRNQLEEARRHFEASLQINPQNADAHCNLGRALSLKREFAQAETHFQAALQIKPTGADIHQSYAAALLQQGKTEAALVQLREAVRLEPTPAACLQLAGLLFGRGAFREAAAQYRQALALQPDSLEALNNLAWLLATCPDAAARNGADAVRFSERACQLTGWREAGPMGTLAAAYAEAGRFQGAVDTAEKAAAIADATGNPQFAAMNRQMQSLYRAGQPFRQPAPGAAR